MFIGAVLVMVPNWKEPNHPSQGEWINKLWYVHTMKQHLFRKPKKKKKEERKELLKHGQNGQTSKTLCRVKQEQNKSKHFKINLHGTPEKIK